MLIKGSFDRVTGRPFVDGLLFIPRLNKKSSIDFLVDTGADITTLNPGDGKRIGIDYNSLNYTSEACGAGCKYKEAEETAIVGFITQTGESILYRIVLSISPYSKDIEELPSMLGTDVLRQWRITWDYQKKVLKFGVLTYDKLYDG